MFQEARIVRILDSAYLDVMFFHDVQLLFGHLQPAGTFGLHVWQVIFPEKCFYILLRFFEESGNSATFLEQGGKKSIIKPGSHGDSHPCQDQVFMIHMPIVKSNL